MSLIGQLSPSVRSNQNFYILVEPRKLAVPVDQNLGQLGIPPKAWDEALHPSY
jgi:hypothetical protein